MDETPVWFSMPTSKTIFQTKILFMHLMLKDYCNNHAAVKPGHPVMFNCLMFV